MNNSVWDNVCISCQSDELEVIDSGLEPIDGNSYFYTFCCEKCGKTFTVWYDLVFSEIVEHD